MKSEVTWLGSKQNCTDIYFRVVWKRRLKSVGVLYLTCDRCAFQGEEGTRRSENMNSIINIQEKRKRQHCWSCLCYKNVLGVTVCIYIYYASTGSPTFRSHSAEQIIIQIFVAKEIL